MLPDSFPFPRTSGVQYYLGSQHDLTTWLNCLFERTPFPARDDVTCTCTYHTHSYVILFTIISRRFLPTYPDDPYPTCLHLLTHSLTQASGWGTEPELELSCSRQLTPQVRSESIRLNRFVRFQPLTSHACSSIDPLEK